MYPYAIVADASCDLPDSYLNEHEILNDYAPYMMEDVVYEGENSLTHKEFYDKLRKGIMPSTSALSPEAAKHLIEPNLKKGLDTICIPFSSGISSTCQNFVIAANELSEKYPKRKIFVVDSLCASGGHGLLVMQAVKKRDEGMPIEELAPYLERVRLSVSHVFTVEDLFHLQRGGRISKAKAIIGTLANIKPVLHMDEEGKLTIIGKARGRKKSLIALVDRMEECTKARSYQSPCIMVTHGDCEEDAIFVRDLIRDRLGVTESIIHPLSPSIGAHTGAGLISLFFWGTERCDHIPEL